MSNISRLFFTGLFGAILLAVLPVMAAEPVGSIERVGVYAYGTIPEKSRAPLYNFDKVFFGERLETIAKGALKVVFVDDTNLYMGSESDVVIDTFVYDPSGGKDAAVLKMTIGTFRYVSGKISKVAVKLDTPAAVIGIRGTDVSIGIDAAGKTTISIAEGEIEVSPKDGSPASVVAAGVVGSVSPGGGGFVAGKSSEAPSDPGIDSGPGSGGGAGGGGDGGGGGGGDGGC